MANKNDNSKIVAKNIKQVKRNFREMMPDLETDLGLDVQRNFRQQKLGQSSSKWQKLTPKYKKWKNRNGGDRALLVRTGKLKNSFATLSRGSMRFTFGSVVPYAKYHNEGMTPQPQRQMLGKNKNLDRAFEKTISKHIFDKI